MNVDPRRFNVTKEQLPKIMMMGAAVVIGILLMLVGSFSRQNDGDGSGKGYPSIQEDTQQVVPSSDLAAAESLLESRLENILGQIAGVGQVSVSVQLAAGPEYEYATDVSTTQRTIDETDQAGGTRLTTEKTKDGRLVLVRVTSGGTEQPVLIKQLKPEILGILVVAEGASDPVIRSKLSQAVQTLFNIPAYQVSVLSKEGR